MDSNIMLILYKILVKNGFAYLVNWLYLETILTKKRKAVILLYLIL